MWLRTSHLCLGILRQLRIASVARRRGFPPRPSCGRNRFPRRTQESDLRAIEEVHRAMPKNILNRAYSRALTKQHKIAIAGVGALGAAALAFTTVPGNAQTVTTDAAATQQVHYADTPVKDVKGSLTDRLAGQTVKLDAVAKQQADA